MSYWTSLDKQLFGKFKAWLRNLISALTRGVFDFFKQGVSLRLGEGLFLGILVVGLALRAATLGSALYLPQEFSHIHQATSLLSSSNRFLYDGDSFLGLLNCLTAIFPMAFAMGAKTVPQNFFITFNGFIGSVYPDLVFVCRLLGLAFFSAALYLIYRLGSRFFQERVGLLAALMVALSPVLIQTGRFVLPHNAVLLLEAIALYLAFAWWEKKRWRAALALGAVCGLLAATLFHFVFLAPLAILGILAVSRRDGIAFTLWLFVFYFAATFYCGFDIPLRLDNLAQQIVSRREYFAPISFGKSFLVLGNQINWIILTSVAASVILLFFEKQKRGVLLFLALLLTAFFLFFYSFLPKAPEDLALILLPAALLAAIFLNRAAGFLRGPVGTLAVTALLAGFLVPAAASVKTESPLFSTRLTSFDKVVPDFFPPAWKKDFVLSTKPPLDFVKQGVIAAYRPEFRPVPLQESRVVFFLPRRSNLKEVIFACNNTGIEPASVAVKLVDGKGEVLSRATQPLPARSGWQDLVFPLAYQIEVGKHYYLFFEKPSQPVMLLESSENPFPEYTVAEAQNFKDFYKNGEPPYDYVWKVRYGDDTTSSP